MKRKFLSILLTLAMALTLLPTAAMAEGDSETPAGGEPTPVEAPAVTKVAKVGETEYATLAEAVDAANNGDTVQLLTDVLQNSEVCINKDITLNLNKKKIYNTKDIWADGVVALVNVKNNANVTITGDGVITAKENDCYAINLVSGTLTIENGNIVGNVSAVQVQTGHLYIKGGTFSLLQKWENKSTYLINMIDAAYKDGSARATITGGTFVDYEPSQSTSEHPNANFVPTGYKVTRDGDSYVVTVKSDNVAEIGDIQYATLADAVAAAKNGETVTLLKDVTEDVTIPAGKTMTLDLNGQKLSNVKGHTITNNGRLTINDSVGTGKVENNGIECQTVYNNPGAVAVLNAGSYDKPNTHGYVVLNHGHMTANKDVKMTIWNGTHSSLFENGWQSYKNNKTDNKSELTINGGIYEGGLNTIKNDDDGVLTINDGTFKNYTQAAFQNHNVATVKGGNFDGASVNAVLNCGVCEKVDETHDQHVLTIENGYFKGAISKNIGTITITGGYFTSDPTAYLAEGKGLVTSDQSAFAYKVGAKATDVETAVTAGEAAVTIPAGVTGITKDDVKSAAKAADTTKTLTDTVAATGMTNDPAVVGTEAAAKAALSAKNISVNNGENVTVVVQPYLEVNVKSADAGKLTLEISAKYNVVATTGNPVTIDPTKTATLKSGVPLSINKPIELTIVLPTGFATASSSIYVQHKGYEYTATVDAYGKTATFINPHGFSTFTVTSTASAIAEVDGTSYTDLQKAVDAVANNGTIKLLKDTSANAVVSRAVKFTLDKNSKSFTGAITAGSGYNLSVDSDVYTFTVRSSSGSSSGSSSSSRRYDVSALSVKHGDVTVSPKSASKGDTVTITVKPDSGYELDTLTVKDASGSKIKVKDKGDGKFTFTMPASKVTVSAEFAEIETLDFADVSTDAYYYEAVKWAAKKGITGGTGDGNFNPNGACTRAHIVTFLWRAAGSPEPKSTVSFADVPADSYYAKAVAWAVENGITLGTGDGTFSPNATCTRAQSVTFLYRALGTAPTTVNGFTDVTADAFYADAVAWAVESGVTNGTSASTFSPNNGCTRAQIVTFLYRTMK